jgi:hypothetical protein
MNLAPTQKRPDLRRYVGVCLTCHHWQVDLRGGAISDLGGWLEAMKAIGEAHAAHVGALGTDPDADLCPGAGGRVKFGDRWVDPPKMTSGNDADGTLALHPLPRWWVTK